MWLRTRFVRYKLCKCSQCQGPAEKPAWRVNINEPALLHARCCAVPPTSAPVLVSPPLSARHHVYKTLLLRRACREACLESKHKGACIVTCLLLCCSVTFSSCTCVSSHSYSARHHVYKTHERTTLYLKFTIYT